ncbi:MAG: YihY family inner membrane protein [Luteitalea sp.]|nr:YihY family inner membrane protein [Luteitalea sp.]
MLRALRIPIGWTELFKRTGVEVMADNCFGLAAQLAYYFFLALFPALLFLVALISFLPFQDLMDTITAMLGRVAPGDVMSILRDQIGKIAEKDNSGLLTLGMLGTIWSTSSGVTAIIDSLNQAYDIQEGRPWWKVRLTALGLTVALAGFIVASTILVLVGPTLAEKVAEWFHLGAAFTWTWKIAQWPVVLGLVSMAIALMFYYAPDAEQRFIWITPGSILAAVLWLVTSLAFRFYVTNFAAYNATYGTIGGVIVLMLWLYVSSLAILVGAELNAEIEHASPYGKDPGEKEIGAKKKIGLLAEEAWTARTRPALEAPGFDGNCDVDGKSPPAAWPAGGRRPRPSDWVVGGLVLGEAAMLTYVRLRSRLKKSRSRMTSV